MRILIALLFIFCLLSTASSDIRFEEVSHQAGINRIGESWGNAWGDFDGDGYLDLWATNHKHKPSLYRNNGDGTFTDIIDEVWNANPYADTHGSAWADFDNDGDQDLVVLSGGGGGINRTNAKHDNHFYVNENGMLIERAAEFGIDFPLLRGRAPLWLDWNRDGYLDLIMTGRARPDSTGALISSSLFEQTRHGFEIMNSASGCNIENDSSIAQLTDLTGDGAMEVVVEGNPYPQVVYDISSTAFRVLEAINFPKIYNVLDAVFADFNGDLSPDVFLARGIYRSYIDTEIPKQIKMQMQTNRGEKGVSFKTEGDVRFEIHSIWTTQLRQLRIGADGHTLKAFDGEHIPSDPIRNVGSFIFVLSPDDARVAGLKPRPEVENYGIYVGYDPEQKVWTLLYHTQPSIDTNWSGLEARIKSEHPISEVEPINFTPFDLRANPQSTLLLKKGNQFEQAATFLDGRSVVAGDFDNDMDIDIYLVRSSSAGNLPNHLYENRGNGTFTQLANAGGAVASMDGRGQSVTMADYDSDGYLDFFVTNGRGAYPFNEGPDQLFRNIGSGNNWIQVDLEGTVSNRDGIGAKLFATTPDGKTQLRENGGGIHWSQQNQKRTHFGLAQNQAVSELAIHWPSGIVQKLTDVSVNQVLHVVEPDVQVPLRGDVNEDGVVNISDLAFVATHIGASPLTDTRADANGDGEVDLDDIIWIIKAIGVKLTAAGPSNQSLSEEDFAVLSDFYEKIEDISTDFAQIELVKRFLSHLLMPAERPMETKLHANYPNPFNPETWIPYQLAEDAEITIRIYNASGHVVRTVFSGHQASGYYLSRSKAAYWDGKNEFGEQVASGVYIYELTTPTFKQTKRLVVLK